MSLEPVRRAVEAAHLLMAHAAGAASWRSLIAAYAATTADPCSPGIVEIRLKVKGRRFALKMRRCDIYTLAEVLHERQYRIVEELPQRPTIVDAGANIGITALWFLAHRPAARLHCFEPEEVNHGLLCENVAGRGDVTIEKAALGARAGQTVLHLARHGALHRTRRPSGGGAGSPGTDQVEAQPARSGGEGVGSAAEVIGTLTVPSIRLGDYLEAVGLSTVDLLKVDVEGEELELLRGLGPAIARVERIAGEVHEDLVAAEELYDLLGDAGFRILEKERFPSSGDDNVHFFAAARQ